MGHQVASGEDRDAVDGDDHIADPDCLVSATEIRHRPIGPAQVATNERTTRSWLPSGEIQVALTAGASTPNNIVGRVIERLTELAAS